MPFSLDTLLMIDDTPHNVKALLDFLTQMGFTVLFAQDGEEGIQTANYALPDLILLDVKMPGMDGFTVCQILKARENTYHIPILFMSSATDTIDKVKGFQLGAADYLTKPLQHEEVLARVMTHLNLRKQQQQLEAEVRNRQQIQRVLQETQQTLSQKTIELQAQTETLKACHQALDRFAYLITCDLTYPLQTITHITNKLLENYISDRPLDEKFIEDVQTIARIGQQAIDIIEIFSD